MLPARVFSMGRMARSTSPASSAAATSPKVPYPTGSPVASRPARCLRAAASPNEWAEPWKATRSPAAAAPLGDRLADQLAEDPAHQAGRPAQIGGDVFAPGQHPPLAVGIDDG